MGAPLRVLLLEEGPEAEVLVRELRRGGFDPDWQRADTEADYLARLEPSLDVILANPLLPELDVLQALRRLRERAPEVPLILVSALARDDVVVTALRHGAADVVLKERRAWLRPAVHLALQRRRFRREEQAA